MILVNSKWQRCYKRYYRTPSSGILPNHDVRYSSGCVSIIQLKRPEKQVYGWFLASSAAAFFVGVTEPIEFAFMFVAPILYVVHALLTGLSLFIAATFHWTAGFSFSAGLIDYVLSLINPVSNHPLMLLVQGCIFHLILCDFPCSNPSI